MNGHAYELLVFGLVGASATAIYFAVAIALHAMPSFEAHPAGAALVASVASVLWSYAGHHRFTFRKSGSHDFYLPRFIGVSVVLSAMAVAGTYAATHFFGVDFYSATLGVTIAYPIVSFALNRSWVFGTPRALFPQAQTAPDANIEGEPSLNRRTLTDIAIMASLLLGRLAFLLLRTPGLSGDGPGYLKVAQTVIESRKLPELGVQPRGYSLLLAPFVAMDLEVEPAVLIMNVLMDASVVALLLLSARRIFPEPADRTPLLLCWLLAVIQPFTAQMANAVLTETPTMFLVFVGVWLLFIPSNVIAWVSGFVFLGAASLLRIDVLALNVIGIVLYVALFYRNAFDKRAALLGWMLFCSFPVSMLAYQYHSTREMGLVRPDFPQPGYYAWMRRWFAFAKTEHDRFAFSPGSPNWPGFDVANYPSRAFDSSDERDRAAADLKTWRIAGYTETVDQGFRGLEREKTQQHPLRSFVFIPALRMIHFWINLDGAQTYFTALDLRRPTSTLAVALTLALRLLLIAVAVLGAYAIWFRPTLAVTAEVLFARFGSLLVLLRTAELGALGTVAWGGLMEPRYVLVVFPFVILLAFWGVRYVFSMRTARSSRSTSGLDAARVTP